MFLSAYQGPDIYIYLLRYIIGDVLLYIGANVEVLGGPPPSTVHLQYPLGMFWVGSEEAQMESGGTVYNLQQLKRIGINIFVFS